MTVAYAIGLISSWSVLWALTLVVFLDGRSAVKRIEARVDRKEGDGIVNGQVDGEEANKTNGKEMDGDMKSELRRRKGGGNADELRHDEESRKAEEDPGFVWRDLPRGLRHRIHWVTDFVTNFRGIRWSHQISGLPYPNSHSLQAFAGPMSHQTDSIRAASSPSPSKPYPNRSSLLRYNFVSLVATLVFLDFLRFIILKDTYYWGVSSPAPSPFPVQRTSRLILSLIHVYASLNSIFLLGPLVFASPIGKRLLGEIAWPWMYPPLFGSPMEVWRKGLAGFWGGWWHQMFRLAFEQFGEFIAQPLGWEKKSVKGGILRVVAAFVASGTIHACGSYTTLGDTQPARAFMFFTLQPVGLMGQRAVAQWMKKVGFRDRIPAQVRGAANLALVVMWFWLTGPMVADDFAGGGIWLYEPLPISPLRGLAGDGWWRWGKPFFRWHRDERWWKSGLAL